MIKVKSKFLKELIPDIFAIRERYEKEKEENGFGTWDMLPWRIPDAVWRTSDCAGLAMMIYDEINELPEKEEVKIPKELARYCYNKTNAIIEICDERIESDLDSEFIVFYQETKELAEKLKENIVTLFTVYADIINDPFEKFWDLASLALYFHEEAEESPNYLPGLKATLDEMVEIYNAEIKEKLDEEVKEVMSLYFSK